jgi:NlpC/P60 family putative phage cell wall peptidase
MLRGDFMKREDIIAEAREWIGTKWQHQASLKGVACDCAGLVRGVYSELTGKSFDTTVNYPATWHLFKSEPWLYNECKKYAAEIPIEEAGGGDVLLFSFRDRFPAHHIAILTKEGTIIHSYMDAGKVVEVGYVEPWKKFTRNAFRYPGVAD